MKNNHDEYCDVFADFQETVEAWERSPVTDELGVTEGRDVEGSRRTVWAVVTTETDFRLQFQAEGDHAEGTVDIHVRPPERFYTSEVDGKQTYFTFNGYTFKVRDLIPLHATHKCYRAVRFNDAGNDRY